MKVGNYIPLCPQKPKLNQNESISNVRIDRNIEDKSWCTKLVYPKIDHLGTKKPKPTCKLGQN